MDCGIPSASGEWCTVEEIAIGGPLMNAEGEKLFHLDGGVCTPRPPFCALPTCTERPSQRQLITHQSIRENHPMNRSLLVLQQKDLGRTRQGLHDENCTQTSMYVLLRNCHHSIPAEQEFPDASSGNNRDQIRRLESPDRCQRDRVGMAMIAHT
jgi:hypothetical protein